MKSFLKKAVDATMVPLMRHMVGQMPPPAHPAKITVISELERRAAIECADYGQSHMQRAVALTTKTALWDHALSKVELNGQFVEFGVFDGTSINHIAARRPNEVIYGFDSFEGLREDWAGHDCVKGAFDLGGKLPDVVGKVKLIKGWFDQTIPGFLAQHPEPFAFLHCDCDTYEAAKIVFDLAGDRIRKGTVIVFDEYFGYRGWRIGEFKAWQELVSVANIEYEYLAFSTQEVSVRVTKR
jgi:hypothetical protein